MIIDTLKTTLNYKISDGRRKLQVYLNDENSQAKNCIMLFYDNDNVVLARSRSEIGGYYSIGIQVVIRHNDYDTARATAFTALEYINANSKPSTGYLIPDELPPIYLGIDERTGGYTWGFLVKGKGGES